LPSQGKVFISYRWEEAEFVADTLYEKMLAVFDKDQIFLDREDRRYGVDFRDRLNAGLRDCRAMLVLIGPRWNPVTGTSRRLESEHDYVRHEVSEALRTDIPIIPVLFGGAAMPSAGELPENVQKLAFRTYLEIARQHKKEDIAKIIRELREHVRPANRARW
jgi:hypothetical protein